MLLEPQRWVNADFEIVRERFPACLVEAKAIVQRQILGPRAADAWAWADFGMLLVLNGEPSEAAWDELAELATQPFVFGSTKAVLRDLSARIEPVARSTSEPRLVQTLDALGRTVLFLEDSALRLSS